MSKIINKIVLAPDSFKGTMSANVVRRIIGKEIMQRFPKCEIVSIPMADGGEGSLNAIMSAMSGHYVDCIAKNPIMVDMNCEYVILDDKSAVIEMAECAGLNIVNPKQPMKATTFGVGQLILDALDKNIRKFLLCIGGSATNDGGCGMACALGVKFFDKDGNSFIPTGATLVNIVSVDFSQIDSRVMQSEFVVACDVTNPLYGLNGAAYVYAPQKGASLLQVKTIDAGLMNLSSVVAKQLNVDYSSQSGMGAAGGLGFGCKVFLNANINSGIDCMLELSNFNKKIKDADLIITGEGSIDEQSFMGKVIDGILNRSGNIPVFGVCGKCNLSKEFLQEKGITVFTLPKCDSWEQVLLNSESNLALVTKEMLDAINNL